MMDRKNNNRYNRPAYGYDNDRYEGNSRGEARYHHDRNLTDEFERDYRRNREQWRDEQDRYQPHRGYREEAMGSNYNRLQHEDRNFGRNAGDQWRDRDRNQGYDRNFDRDRYSRRQNDSSGRDMHWRSDNSEHVYGVSSFDGSVSRYDPLTSMANAQAAHEEGLYSRWDDRRRPFRASDYRDDSFAGAHNRFTDSGFRHYVFNDEYGTGRGTSFEDYGTMGGNTFGRDRGNITGDNAYNSDRRY